MNVPVKNPIAWISLLPQLGFAVVLISAYHISGIAHAFLLGIVTYLAGSNLIQLFTIRKLRKAFKAIKKGDFTTAIAGFKYSYEVMNKYPWIDKYRYLVLLSSSGIPYREIALSNIAFCYYQIGDIDKAISYYNLIIVEHPEGKLAKTAIHIIDSIREGN